MSAIAITSGGAGKFALEQCRFTQFAQGSKACEGHKDIDAAENVRQISQRYALEEAEDGGRYVKRYTVTWKMS